VQKRLNTDIKKQKSNIWFLVIIVAVVLLVLIAVRSCHTNYVNRNDRWKSADTVKVLIDTMETSQDTIRVDSLSSDTTKSLDTISVAVDTVLIQKKKKHKKKQVDSADISHQLQVDSSLLSKTSQDTLADTIARSEPIKPDTMKSKPESPCETDTSELWIYPDPSGGLHRLSQRIHFYANRPGKIFWRLKGAADWIEYDGNEVEINSTITLQFMGVDTCGREMALREEYYEIEQEVTSVCPKGMAHVQLGDASYCIDIYEWPNKKGVRPAAYVSLYQAADSCFSVGKRLCTADEWFLACSGPFSSVYPYGNSYEERACVTADTMVHKSGGKAECRSYFGLYDMSGNLQEWTDTRSSENDRFNYVAGGFWSSGIKSSCRERRYSYYSQNRHNPVGFRCCQSVETQAQRRKK
jgi:hypothetical protein